MRAAIYSRISKDDGQDRLGVQRQEDDCRALCQRHGWTVREPVYEDDDVSAYSGVTRPEYERLLTDITLGAVDVVVCWSLDRLYRQPQQLEQFLLMVDRHGVRLSTVDGTEITPGEGALVARIRTAVADEEVRKMKARIARKLEQNAQHGKRHGRVPYGWHASGAAHPVQAPYVVELTDRLLAGDTLRGIARDWQARRIPAPTQRPWDTQGLRKIARRASNAGLRQHRGVVVGTGNWDALVSEDRWRAVVALLDSRQRPAPSRDYLMSGLITCGLCSDTLGGVRIARRNEAPTRRYRCNGCKRVSVTVDVVDAAVELATVQALTTGDLSGLLGAARAGKARAATDHAVALRARLDGAAQAYAAGDLDLAQLTAITATLRPQIAAANAEVDRLTDGRMAALDGLPGKRAATAWQGLTRDRRRAVIALLWKVTALPYTGRRDAADRLDIAPRWAEDAQ